MGVTHSLSAIAHLAVGAVGAPVEHLDETADYQRLLGGDVVVAVDARVEIEKVEYRRLHGIGKRLMPKQMFPVGKA